MRVRHSETALPHSFAGCVGAERAVLVGSIRPSRHSHLRMALLIFKNNRDLRRFWKKGLGRGDLSAGCRGAVHNLAKWCYKKRGAVEIPEFMEVDPRWFAVMGLIVGDLSMEVITHEATHAGFAYAWRMKGHGMKEEALRLDEEGVAYPTGAIAAGINRLLYRKGLYHMDAAEKERRKKKHHGKQVR